MVVGIKPQQGLAARRKERSSYLECGVPCDLSATVFLVLIGGDLLSPGLVEKTPKVAHALPGDRT